MAQDLARGSGRIVEATTGFEPVYAVLQTASPVLETAHLSTNRLPNCPLLSPFLPR